jgi:RNA polymerase sigma factor (sigma-70 family)
MKKAQKKVHWDPDRPYRTEVVFSIEQLIIQHQLNKDQQDSLRIALESLPARQKQILFMIYYEGLSIAEISEITSLQYQSIRNFTHRALVKLREILGSIVFFLMTVLS